MSRQEESIFAKLLKLAQGDPLLVERSLELSSASTGVADLTKTVELIKEQLEKQRTQNVQSTSRSA